MRRVKESVSLVPLPLCCAQCGCSVWVGRREAEETAPHVTVQGEGAVSSLVWVAAVAGLAVGKCEFHGFFPHPHRHLQAPIQTSPLGKEALVRLHIPSPLVPRLYPPCPCFRVLRKPQHPSHPSSEPPRAPGFRHAAPSAHVGYQCRMYPTAPSTALGGGRAIPKWRMNCPSALSEHVGVWGAGSLASGRGGAPCPWC